LKELVPKLGHNTLNYKLIAFIKTLISENKRLYRKFYTRAQDIKIKWNLFYVCGALLINTIPSLFLINIRFRQRY